MSWKSHHRRAAVLAEVVRVVEARRNGVLPMEVPGVRETFGDELALLGALTLRWHTRLAGRIEHRLAEQPLDLPSAVVEAWVSTARDMPGVRAVIDRYAGGPTGPDMARAMATATLKERELLALMAGRASGRGEATARAGAAIEERARATYAADRTEGKRRRPGPALVERLRAALAA